MQKFLADFILVTATLIFTSSVAIYLTNKNMKPQHSPVTTPAEGRSVYTDNKGYPKYALGTCASDSDCTPAGCSEQICSSNPELVTTCEIREDFPSQDTYSCGCVEGLCAWFEK